MKYIDAEVLKKELTKAPVWTTLAVKEIIDETATVDIVRCQDCKQYNGNEEYCTIDHYATENGFCSYGERGADDE